MPVMIAYVTFCAFAMFLMHRLVSSRSKHFPLPPGPPQTPIIGNAHQAPKSHAWLQYREWAKTYGPIFHLNMLGQPIIILSSLQAAHDLLSKRGAKYSDRPRLVMASEIAFKNQHILLRQNDAEYRLHKKLEAPFLNLAAANNYLAIHNLESRQMIYDLLAQGNCDEGLDPHRCFERAITSTLYSLAYGFRLKTANEPELLEAHALQEEHFKMFLKPGTYLVDMFPILNNLPNLLAPWKKEGEAHYAKQCKLHVGNLRRGYDSPGWNMAKQMQNSIDAKNMSIEEVALSLGLLCEAALETTTSTMDWFVIACLTQSRGPDGFVAKAQNLIDGVVGRDRLPAFDDRANLIYIDALVEEILRWRPTIAAGIPHFTKTEDVYQGYRIPAGSIVISPIWTLSRDAIFGANPDAFVPERWLDEGNDTDSDNSLKKMPSPGFGIGRRMCTGRHIAKNILFIQIARMLWAFDIEAGISDTGEKMTLDSMAATDAVGSKPLPFRASFRPRNPRVRDIVMRQCFTLDEDIGSLLSGMGMNDTVRAFPQQS